MPFLFRKKTPPEVDHSKTIVIEFDKNGNKITKLSNENEQTLFNYFSNKNKNKIYDLQNAIELLNNKFLIERKNLTDTRKELTRKKNQLLKTDDEMLYQCKICYENIIDTYLPCGHVFCQNCAVSSKDENDLICPNCRTVFTSSYKIFL